MGVRDATAKLTASDGAANDQLGYSVAVSGDGSTMFAGAPLATVNGNIEQGAAYIPSELANPSLSLAVPSSGLVGGLIVASARLTGGAAPTGTVTFKVFGPQPSPPSDCASGGTTVATAPVGGIFPYPPTGAFSPLTAGDYWWYAGYSGDAETIPPSVSAAPGWPRPWWGRPARR